MNIIALIDTRPELPRETIGTVISTHGTMAAAFKANEAFQSRMRASGVKSGVSSGIGEGTARVLAEHGASVVLGAHRTDKLMSIATFFMV